MNAPMSDTHKTIYGKRNGIQLPHKIKRLLIGAVITWCDENPLSQDITDELHFYFNSHTSTMTDLLLRKHGVHDISQYVNIPLHWGIEMELHYAMPNRRENIKAHIDTTYFEFHGTIFPLHPKFIKARDAFYLLKNMEYLGIPEDHKNWKKYVITKFKATVIGV